MPSVIRPELRAARAGVMVKATLVEHPARDVREPPKTAMRRKPELTMDWVVMISIRRVRSGVPIADTEVMGLSNARAVARFGIERQWSDTPARWPSALPPHSPG